MQSEVQSVAQQASAWGITLEGWLTLAAILVGPIIAIQVQTLIERRREQRNRKLFLFRELMATRGSRISHRHVDALNAIQVEYYAKKGQDRVV